MISKAIFVNIRQQIRDNTNTEAVKEVASFLRSVDPAELVLSVPVEIVVN